MHAQIVLFDGFDPMDVVGPYEVLYAGGLASGGALSVELVSAGGPRTVLSGSGELAMTATATLDVEHPDLIIVPGASGLFEPNANHPGTSLPERLAATTKTELPVMMRRALDDPGVLVATVCGGSLALAMAGLLVGRRAVTHHLAVDALAAGGAIPIQARIVDDGDLITAGGVTSGLDLGLYLLERCLGPRISLEVEALFDYERRGTVWSAKGAEPVITFAPGAA